MKAIVHSALAQKPALRRDEESAFTTSAEVPVTMSPVIGECVARRRMNGHQPIFAPFGPANTEKAVLQIDILQLQIDGLPDPKPRDDQKPEQCEKRTGKDAGGRKKLQGRPQKALQLLAGVEIGRAALIAVRQQIGM